MAMSSWILYASAVAFFLLSGSAKAQELCSCSPSTYTFTLDFSLTCPPVSVTRNPAITATFCQISPLGDANETITDLVPVEVESLGILELGQEFEVLSQHNITGPLISGDTFDYTSLIDADGYDGAPVRVIQLNIFATNALGESIVNFFAISFTNTCDEYPALIEGDSAGWTKFVSFPTAMRSSGIQCLLYILSSGGNRHASISHIVLELTRYFLFPFCNILDDIGNTFRRFVSSCSDRTTGRTN